MDETQLNPAAAVATALQVLFETYSTDAEGTAAAVVLTVTDPATGTQHTIELQPGQAEWLTELTMDEIANCRNAHSDGTGQCGHCGGTGDACKTDPADLDGYLGDDGLIYHGDGEVDIEASAEMLSQEAPEDEEETEYQPVRWCEVCGWSTEDTNEVTCHCPDGIPRGSA